MKGLTLGATAPRALGLLAAIAAIVFAGLGAWIAAFGTSNETLVRVGMFAVALTAVLLADIAKQTDGARPRWLRIGFDVLLLVVLAASVSRYLEIGKALESGLFFLSAQDIWLGVAGITVLMVLTLRLFGMPLFIVVALCIAYAVFGQHLPGLLRHSGFRPEQLMQVIWYGFDGVFGTPVAVVVTVVLVYILFGAALEAIGAGDALIKLSFAATGRTRGGPAHAAVVASGLFGTLSGSTIANIVGTGVITMPMIRERGFPARFAGGIETAASNGGSLMPPVMGAVAFIMADVTGIPYITICIAALVPALLYYASLFLAVQVEAVKRDIKPLSPEETPRLVRADIGLVLAFVIPLAGIVLMLVQGRSPAMAGVVATALVFVVGIVGSPLVWREPRRLIEAFVNAGITGSKVIVAVGAVGIIIGVLNLTGIGLRLAGEIADLAGDSLFLGLLLMAVSSLILGMGLPVVPAYLIIVIVMGPAIESFGVPTLIVHLFVVYYAVFSSITPPVAIAAFAAAPIAKAGPVAVGVEAIRLSAVGLIIPFMLIEVPALTIVEGFAWPVFLIALLRIGFGMWMLTSGLAGFGTQRLAGPSRILRIVAGAGLLIPGLWITLAGAALCAVALSESAIRKFFRPQSAGSQH